MDENQPQTVRYRLNHQQPTPHPATAASSVNERVPNDRSAANPSHSGAEGSRGADNEGSCSPRKPRWPATRYPSFEIIENKSFGTLMHELWIRFQGEFGLSMLETWEVIMIYVVVLLLILLFYVAIFKYLPSHIKVIGRRTKYYLVGSE